MTSSTKSAPCLSSLRTDWTDRDVERDLHLLIRWRCKDAVCRDEFIKEAGQQFQVLSVYECEWSREYWPHNLARFYGAHSMVGTTKLREIGFEPFLAVIVSDDSPAYAPCEFLGGEVDVANRAIIDFKSRMRAVAGENICHSTSSRYEFLVQSTLLLGLENATQLESNDRWDGVVGTLHRDIEGTKGWESFERMVAYLNHSCRWLVLRNFENLPEGLFAENDIDVLTENMELFSAIAGLEPGEGLGRYVATIADERINVDVRCLGDGYYPTLWEIDLLATRTWTDKNLPRPEPIHHFFSLLYHARLHKPSLSERYITALSDIAQQIRFDEVTEESIRDDVRSANLITGFMKSRLYPIQRPLDSRVFWNRSFLRLMSGFEIVSPSVLRKRRLLRFLRLMLPSWTYHFVPRWVRVAVKSRLNH